MSFAMVVAMDDALKSNDMPSSTVGMDSMGEGRKDEIADFLLMTRPRGWHTICAINEQACIGRSFLMPDEVDVCARYIIKKNNNSFNIYWTVNDTQKAIHKKAKKYDIKEVLFIHVDIDPTTGNYQHSRKALLDRIDGIIEKYHPTLIIDSGNGMQVFWKLKTPLSVSEAEVFNQTAMVELKGDKGTSNADRLMRVAGTLNIPSKNKIEKGYPKEPGLAQVLYYDESAFFVPSLFPQIVEKSLKAETHDLASSAQSVNAWRRFLDRRPDIQAIWDYEQAPDNHSDTLMSILNHLAFYCSKNAQLMRELFEQSAFCQCPNIANKWFNEQHQIKGQQYAEYHLYKAIAGQMNSYGNTTGFDLSHDTLALELGHQWFNDNARHVHLWGKWLLWDGKCWLMDERLTHLSVIREFLREKAGLLNQWSNSLPEQSDEEHKHKEQALKWAKLEARSLKSAPMRLNIDSIIKTDPQCTLLPEAFDSNRQVIGTPDGTVKLKSGQLISPERNHYITRLTKISPDNNSPVLWLKFLNDIFSGDVQVISFMQRLCGYILTGLTKEQKLFFLYGSGANGKSIFMETLYFILGDYARKAQASLFLEQRNEQHSTGIAGLKGARLVIGSELPAGKTWNEQIIKDMTGGDTMTARFMRQDYFDFMPQFTLLIAGNHQPRLKNVDESVVRRMVMIPFAVTIPTEQRDPDLGDKLKNEAGAILSWCIEGAVSYFKEGLNIPDIVIKASRDYLDNEDVTGEFIDTYLQQQPYAKEKCSIVWQNYRYWMKEQGNDYVKPERQFRKELKDRGVNISRSNSIYWINGYCLKDDAATTTGWDE